MESSLCASYGSGTAELNPRNSEDRPAVSIWEREDVLFIVLEDIDPALANVVHTNAQSKEFTLCPNVRSKADLLDGMLTVESTNYKNKK